MSTTPTGRPRWRRGGRIALGLAVAACTVGAAHGASAAVTPTTLETTLAVGESTTLTKTVSTPAAPTKLDVCLLSDLSGSFFDDLAVLQGGAAEDMFDGVRAVTADSHFAVAGFSDVVDSFTYQRFGAIDPDKADFLTAVSGMTLESGGDFPEALFDGVAAAAGPGPTTLPGRDPEPDCGWRADPGVQRVLVATTDATSHTIDEGAQWAFNLASATAKLTAQGITLIGLKAEGAGDELDDLAAATGGSVVDLESDGSNIAEAVLAGLSEIEHTVTGTPDSCAPYLDVTLTPPTRTGVPAGDSVTFSETVTVAQQPPTSPFVCTVNFTAGATPVGTQTLTVTVPGGGEEPKLEPLAVGKTAYPSYRQLWEWRVEKRASSKVRFEEKKKRVVVNYAVAVIKKRDGTDRHKVTGEIALTNANATPIAFALADTLPGAKCEIGEHPGTIGAKTRLAVPYVCYLDELPKGPLTNTASVRSEAGPSSATAPVNFSKARVSDRHDGVKVVDIPEGEKPQVLASRITESELFRYHRYLPAGEKCRVWENKALALGLDEPDLRVNRPEVLAADTASVRICPPKAPKDPKGGKPKGTRPVVTIGAEGDKKPAAPAKVTTGPGSKTDPVVSIALTKRADVVKAPVGSTVRWTITVANTGAAVVKKVEIKDRLPRHLKPILGSVEGARLSKGTLSLYARNIEPGQGASVTLLTKVGSRPRAARPPVKTLSAKQRVAHRRAARGIVCNKAIAVTDGGVSSEAALACIRVVRR